MTNDDRVTKRALEYFALHSVTDSPDRARAVELAKSLLVKTLLFTVEVHEPDGTPYAIVVRAPNAARAALLVARHLIHCDSLTEGATFDLAACHQVPSASGVFGVRVIRWYTAARTTRNAAKVKPHKD